MTDVVPATGALLRDILAARHRAEPGGLSAHAHAQWHAALMKTSWGSRGRETVALLKDGAAVASAERYDLQAAADGRPLLVRGIGSVCSEPTPDGVEGACALVRSLAEEARAPIVLLFPSPAVDDLVIDGFDTMPTTNTTLTVTEDTRNAAPMTMVRAGEERDLQAIVAMGRTRAEGFRFHLDRDVDFVRYVITRRRLMCGLGPAHARELHFFIAEEGVTAAAYIVISATPGRWVIEECGDRDPSGARIGALLQALIAREPNGERPSITASLPAGFLPPQVRVVPAAPVSSRVRMAVRDASTSPAAPFAAEDVLYWLNDVL